MQKTLLADNPIRQWLIKEIYVLDWIFFDGWSLVHFVNGCLLGLVLSWFLKGWKLFLLGFLLLIAYELWENGSSQMIFSTEQPLDYIWDLIVGMFGIVLSQVLLKVRRK